MASTKEILVFSRMHITNYGDPIIADCCKYIIEKTAREENIPVNVEMADIFEEDQDVLRAQLAGKKVVVFPGGGLNSVPFNRRVRDILVLIKQEFNGTRVFFNAVGINCVNPNPKNAQLLTKIFKRKFIHQITTRGDYDQLLQYIIEPKKYPPKLVFDPAIWVDEAYHVQKEPDATKIGIGVIRPEIYAANGNDVAVEDVFSMYSNIIHELNARGYKWELFTNGMKKDYAFGTELLEHLNLKKRLYMRPNVQSCEELVQRIAGYKGVIAARLHANILATSLRIPSVGLVWNDKMNQFANIIGKQNRYINGARLQDAPYIIDQLEEAMQNGYDEQRIADMKAVTVETIKNIIR